MSIRTLSQQLSKANELSSQVCIVGGGIAGLLAAHQFDRAGISVLVLESGGLEVSSHFQQLTGVEVASGESAMGETRFRCLGGASVRWGGRFLPIAPWETRDRPYLDLPGWPVAMEHLERHRDSIEQLFGLSRSSYEADVLDRLDPAGLIPRDDPDFVPRVPKWAPFNRCNVGSVLRPRLEASRTTDVILEATVCNFQYDATRRRLVAVEARDLSGDSLHVQAHDFIFAAGTIETTRLVLLLDQLTNGRAFAGCEVLGRYFQQHLGAKVADLRPRDRATTNRFFGYRFKGGTRRSLHLDLSPRAQETDKVGGAIVHSYMVPTEDAAMAVVKRLLRSRQSGDHRLSARDVARLARQSDELLRGVFWRVVNNQHYWPADLKHQLDVWIEQLPCSENRLELSERHDALGVPMARVHWAPRETDERTFRACISRLKSFWSRNRIGHACDLEWIPEASDNSASLTAIAVPINHPSGTTRLGTDPRASVVDPQFRCHSVPNLSLASASVFPSSGSAGPTYTIAEIALAVADRVGASIARERVSAD